MSKKPRNRTTKSKKPVTIELEADEVTLKGEAVDTQDEVEKEPVETTDEPSESIRETVADDEPVSDSSENAEPVAPATAKPPKSGSVASGIAGGVIALIGAAGLQYFNYIPTLNGDAAGKDANAAIIQALEDKVAAFEKKLAAAEEPSVDTAEITTLVEQKISELRSSTENQTLDLTRIDEQVGTIDSQIKQLMDQMAATETKLTSIDSRMSSGQAGENVALSTITERVDELGAQFSALRATAGSGDSADEREELQKSISALEERSGVIAGQIATLAQSVQGLAETKDDPQLIEGLQSRIDEITATISKVETDVAANQAQLASVADQKNDNAENRIAMALTAATLKSQIDQGLPFEHALSRLGKLDATTDLNTLAQFSKTGVPTQSQIVKEFAGIRSAILSETQDSEDAGFADRLINGVKSLVELTPLEPIEGDDTAAVVSRIGAALDGGQLGIASSTWDKLPEPVRKTHEGFHQKLLARLVADETVEKTLDAIINSTNGS